MLVTFMKYKMRIGQHVLIGLPEGNDLFIANQERREQARWMSPMFICHVRTEDFRSYFLSKSYLLISIRYRENLKV